MAFSHERPSASQHSPEHHNAQVLGGCSALSFTTTDGKHLFARNYDFPSAQGSAVTFIPRKHDIVLLQHDEHAPHLSARYACIGMGFVGYATPSLYDGVNECGLCGGMLYYPGFATYETNANAKHHVSPAFYLTALLTQCATLEEALSFIGEYDFSNEEIIPGMRMPIHYFLTDRTGEAVIIEPDATGVSVYRHSIGVLTNAPSYPWHLTNLRNYLRVTPEQPAASTVLGQQLAPFGVGAGGQGLPGDYTPPARFVRLAFAKNALPEGKDERDGVTKMLSALGCVAMPQGLVRNSEGVIEETLYSAVMCAETMSYYVTLYSNRRLTAYSLKTELEGTELKQFTLPLVQDIAMGNF